ncbi:MAG TPA: RNA polymerase sigma factor [Terriglobales bacterium]|nr:RNA polymerase sigma factor [Terriglobales bacterium]
MPEEQVVTVGAAAHLSDEEIVARVLAGDRALFEILMRRYNQRLYRVARAILREDAEAEDVMQEAYVRAYEHLDQFAGRAKFSTWLTKIAVHEALARAQKRGRFDGLDSIADLEGDIMASLSKPEQTPERAAAQGETARLLEQSIEALPAAYRSVLVLRDVEEMSTAETAEALGLTESNVKIRLHRAHALLRRELYARAGAKSVDAFQFHASRCDRVVENVMARIAMQPAGRA